MRPGILRELKTLRQFLPGNPAVKDTPCALQRAPGGLALTGLVKISMGDMRQLSLGTHIAQETLSAGDERLARPRPSRLSIIDSDYRQGLRARERGHESDTCEESQLRQFLYTAWKARPGVTLALPRERARQEYRQSRPERCRRRGAETPHKSIASHRVRTTKRGPRLASDHQ